MPLNYFSKVVSRLRNRHFAFIDINIMFITPLLAIFLRFDGKVDWPVYGESLLLSFITFTPLKLLVFYYFGVYKRYWKLASIDELAYLIFLGINTTIIQVFVFGALRGIESLPYKALPYSFAIIDSFLTIVFVATARFSIRFFERAKERVSSGSLKERVLIAGAGQAGSQIVLEMQRNPQIGLHPVAFVDDDLFKKNMRIRGLNVLGDCNDIPRIIKERDIRKVIVAMPTAPGKKIRDMVAVCNDLNIEVLTVPGIFEILNGKVSVDKIRKIQIEDLLRREPITTDIQRVSDFIKGKRVLITGAGGSIGSELCRQIMAFYPSQLILLGHGENSIFEIDQELRFRIKDSRDGNAKKIRVTPVIADIKSKERLREIFNRYKPEVIFHAAAHKHVPLMESDPCEAVTNNIIGTKNLVETSVEFNVNSYIQISTDKAVNPTSIMGASKRVAEMIVLDAARMTGNYYSAVRFGNVLGSRGSVVQTFKKQIANGGPITITHKDIERYFMTIPEAVQLVLQASVLGKGGEVFVFDMGTPVKIYDMARDIIRLSGLREGIDIGIEVTGLREGEKLYEELFNDSEEYELTMHDKIMIAKNASYCIPDSLEEVLEEFSQIKSNNRETIINKLFSLIPEFNPKDEITVK